MRKTGELLIESWSVNYGDEAESEMITVPHSWRQDMSLSDEGPVEYKAIIEVPRTPSKLRFMGVSFAAEVSIDGEMVATHFGIWDAFDVSLKVYAGTRIQVAVSVVKNGGGSYPVADVASGFLPYVFHTFGGIYGEVILLDEDVPLSLPAPVLSRVSVTGTQMHLDGRPFYMRGLLHWGWYPELGHTNAPEDTIRREVQAAKKLGFNLVKFCLWIPPQRYLEILKEESLEAWIELPFWQPSRDPESLEKIANEIDRIVRQYRHHDNILLWTIGCELGNSAPAEFRSRVTLHVKNLTSAALVKDSSGGAEMYGGDLREFGDFYDFHPYCDTEFFPDVLNLLLPGPRKKQPVLLGEFNDIDTHRDLALLGNEIPFWASNLSELNDRGVRWQYDLPEVLRSNRFSLYPEKESHRALMESARQKALFVRKTVNELVRARDEISGYVLTGWRDTPISSSGFFDDWDDPRFCPGECASWNGDACLFMIPSRKTPWIGGGNRPVTTDPFNLFVGRLHWKVGVHSQSPIHGGLIWRIVDSRGVVVGRGSEPFASVDPLISTEIGQINWHCDLPGEYQIQIEFGPASNAWPLWITEPLLEEDLGRWTTDDPQDVFGFASQTGKYLLTTRLPIKLEPGLVLLTTEGTQRKPFWRESAYEFKNQAFWKVVPFAERWSRILPICPDRVIDPGWLDSLGVPYETLLRRIDVRTYEEHAVAIRFSDTIITTLRPFGGLGNQPIGIPDNPAGTALLRCLGSYLAG